MLSNIISLIGVYRYATLCTSLKVASLSDYICSHVMATNQTTFRTKDYMNYVSGSSDT
jgi:hypothetical protein